MLNNSRGVPTPWTFPTRLISLNASNHGQRACRELASHPYFYCIQVSETAYRDFATRPKCPNPFTPETIV